MKSYYMSDNEAERKAKREEIKEETHGLKTKRKMNQTKIMKRENQRIE
jgi:hypothetical protein